MAAAIEEGRICIKIKGADAGEEVVITKVLDDNFVMARPLKGKGKEARAAIRHLEPTPRKA